MAGRDGYDSSGKPLVTREMPPPLDQRSHWSGHQVLAGLRAWDPSIAFHQPEGVDGGNRLEAAIRLPADGPGSPEYAPIDRNPGDSRCTRPSLNEQMECTD